jgi:hypothetical protein
MIAYMIEMKNLARNIWEVYQVRHGNTDFFARSPAAWCVLGDVTRVLRLLSCCLLSRRLLSRCCLSHGVTLRLLRSIVLLRGLLLLLGARMRVCIRLRWAHWLARHTHRRRRQCVWHGGRGGLGSPSLSKIRVPECFLSSDTLCWVELKKCLEEFKS